MAQRLAARLALRLARGGIGGVAYGALRRPLSGLAPETIAAAIQLGIPGRAVETLSALYSTGGTAALSGAQCPPPAASPPSTARARRRPQAGEVVDARRRRPQAGEAVDARQAGEVVDARRKVTGTSGDPLLAPFRKACFDAVGALNHEAFDQALDRAMQAGFEPSRSFWSFALTNVFDKSVEPVKQVETVLRVMQKHVKEVPARTATLVERILGTGLSRALTAPAKTADLLALAEGRIASRAVRAEASADVKERAVERAAERAWTEKAAENADAAGGVAQLAERAADGAAPSDARREPRRRSKQQLRAPSPGSVAAAEAAAEAAARAPSPAVCVPPEVQERMRALAEAGDAAGLGHAVAAAWPDAGTPHFNAVAAAVAGSGAAAAGRERRVACVLEAMAAAGAAPDARTLHLAIGAVGAAKESALRGARLLRAFAERAAPGEAAALGPAATAALRRLLAAGLTAEAGALLGELAARGAAPAGDDVLRLARQHLPEPAARFALLRPLLVPPPGSPLWPAGSEAPPPVRLAFSGEHTPAVLRVLVDTSPALALQYYAAWSASPQAPRPPAGLAVPLALFAGLPPPAQLEAAVRWLAECELAASWALSWPLVRVALDALAGAPVPVARAEAFVTAGPRAPPPLSEREEDACAAAHERLAGAFLAAGSIETARLWLGHAHSRVHPKRLSAAWLHVLVALREAGRDAEARELVAELSCVQPGEPAPRLPRSFPFPRLSASPAAVH